MLRQHSLAERVTLDERDSFKSGPLSGKIDSAYSAEQ
jgi:hypothetical protein